MSEALSISGNDLIASFIPLDTLGNKITSGQTVTFSIYEVATGKFYNISTNAFDLGTEPSLISAVQSGTTGVYLYTLTNAYTPGNTSYRLRVVAAGTINRDYPTVESLSAEDSSARTQTVPLKKNTAITAFEFVMLSATTGDPLPGLSTIAAQRSLDGAAFASMANTPSAVGSGVYKINIAAADVNCSTGTWKFSATGAKDTLITFITAT